MSERYSYNQIRESKANTEKTTTSESFFNPKMFSFDSKKDQKTFKIVIPENYNFKISTTSAKTSPRVKKGMTITISASKNKKNRKQIIKSNSKNGDVLWTAGKNTGRRCSEDARKSVLVKKIPFKINKNEQLKTSNRYSFQENETKGKDLRDRLLSLRGASFVDKENNFKEENKENNNYGGKKKSKWDRKRDVFNSYKNEVESQNIGKFENCRQKIRGIENIERMQTSPKLYSRIKSVGKKYQGGNELVLSNEKIKKYEMPFSKINTNLKSSSKISRNIKNEFKQQNYGYKEFIFSCNFNNKNNRSLITKDSNAVMRNEPNYYQSRESRVLSDANNNQKYTSFGFYDNNILSGGSSIHKANNQGYNYESIQHSHSRNSGESGNYILSKECEKFGCKGANFLSSGLKINKTVSFVNSNICVDRSNLADFHIPKFPKIFYYQPQMSQADVNYVDFGKIKPGFLNKSQPLTKKSKKKKKYQAMDEGQDPKAHPFMSSEDAKKLMSQITHMKNKEKKFSKRIENFNSKTRNLTIEKNNRNSPILIDESLNYKSRKSSISVKNRTLEMSQIDKRSLPSLLHCSDLDSKLSDFETKQIIIHNLQKLETEVRKLNLKSEHESVEASEKGECLDRIYEELRALRSQISFIDPEESKHTKDQVLLADSQGAYTSDIKGYSQIEAQIPQYSQLMDSNLLQTTDDNTRGLESSKILPSRESESPKQFQTQSQKSARPKLKIQTQVSPSHKILRKKQESSTVTAYICIKDDYKDMKVRSTEAEKTNGLKMSKKGIKNKTFGEGFEYARKPVEAERSFLTNSNSPAITIQRGEFKNGINFPNHFFGKEMLKKSINFVESFDGTDKENTDSRNNGIINHNDKGKDFRRKNGINREEAKEVNVQGRSSKTPRKTKRSDCPGCQAKQKFENELKIRNCNCNHSSKKKSKMFKLRSKSKKSGSRSNQSNEGSSEIVNKFFKNEIIKFRFKEKKFDDLKKQLKMKFREDCTFKPRINRSSFYSNFSKSKDKNKRKRRTKRHQSRNKTSILYSSMRDGRGSHRGKLNIYDRCQKWLNKKNCKNRILAKKLYEDQMRSTSNQFKAKPLPDLYKQAKKASFSPRLFSARSNNYADVKKQHSERGMSNPKRRRRTNRKQAYFTISDVDSEEQNLTNRHNPAGFDLEYGTYDNFMMPENEYLMP